MNDVFCPQCSEYVAPKWRDARKEAPPMNVEVLAWEDHSVVFRTYLGGNGQKSRELPNENNWGYWSGDDRWEGPRQIRWWMFKPDAPLEERRG